MVFAACRRLWVGRKRQTPLLRFRSFCDIAKFSVEWTSFLASDNAMATSDTDPAQLKKPKALACWDQWLIDIVGSEDHTHAETKHAVAFWLSRNAASDAEKRLLQVMSSTRPSLLAIAKGLIECGASPKARSPHHGDKKTALMVAAYWRRPECVRLLLPLSDPKAIAQFNATALMLAALGGNAECVDLLLPDSDSLAQGSQAETALMFAARLGHTDCVRLLSSNEAAKLPNASGATPLMAALENGHLKCVKILLPFSDPSQRDKSGLNALIMAAQAGNAELVSAFLPGSDATATDNEGMNALMHAAGAGCMECVSALLPHVDVHAVNKHNRCAMDVAREHKQGECAALIERHALAAIAANGVFSAPLSDGAGVPSKNLEPNSPKKGLLRL